MTRFLVSFVSAVWILSGEAAVAQLTTKLQAEPLAELARDARQNGDAIRGAILFPQASLACTQCHAEVGNDLLGPNLTRPAEQRTDEYLVESILNPSKVIPKGFETTQILTLAGQVHSGRLLSSEGDTIVLRENADSRRRLTFQQSEIDEIATSPKSLMPEGLADQLKDRQQFLDLARYVMQLHDASNVAETPARVARTELEPHLQGLVLLDNFQCASCHTNDLISSPIPPKHAPRLTQLAGMLDPGYIEKFIADPAHIKPGTTMPAMLNALPQQARVAVAKQITHFLASKTTERYQPPQTDSEAAVRGETLFHSVGCVACHSPRNASGQPLLPESSVDLGQLQYSLAGLTQFLEDPHAVRPAGRMPNMKLDHFSAEDIANYLLSQASSPDPAEFQFDPELAQQGGLLFQQYQCSSCHDEPELAPSAAPQSTARTLATADFAEGCLSGKSGAWPQFVISDSQTQLIRQAVGHFREVEALSSEQQIHLSLATFRCTACHDRGTLGGVADERDDYFQTTNPNLGPQGRIPPTLTGVGAKLKPKWLREVLVSGRAIRPYAKTRMPQFGTANIEHLIDLFQRQDTLPAVELAETDDQEEQKRMREAGFELVSEGGLNCIACHTFQEKPAMTMPAVDLTEMHERLKPAWFYHYMLEPKRFHRGTVMPAFWPDGKSARKEILAGDTHQQISAIWEWMKDGRQARTPQGLVREPMQLLAAEDAVMLRRSYNGIGKRGIGVGYPQLVNLAFDAEQMRVGLLWQGKFADPSGVWRGQGHGTVQPLSREQIKFRPGPELDDRERPWEVDDGRPPQHHFKGYVLDTLRRPTFLYEFEDVAIEDFCLDIRDSTTSSIRRTITLRSESARPGLAFRMAPQDKMTQISPTEFSIGNMLIVRLQGPAEGVIEESDAGATLVIPIDLEAAQPQQLILEYEWQAKTGL